MTQTETIEALQKQLNDIEADIQAALNSMRGRVMDLKITTHLRRDRPDEEGRPGFYRKELTLDKHVEAVVRRADLEKTTGSLNHKNWASVVNGLVDVSQGSVEDGNKIALRVDDLRNVLRMMHLLRQHLASTAHVLPALPPEKQATTSSPARPAPVITKPGPDLKVTPAEGMVMSQDASATTSPLAGISFTDEPDEVEGSEEAEPDEDDDDDADDEPEETPRWQEVAS